MIHLQGLSCIVINVYSCLQGAVCTYLDLVTPSTVLSLMHGSPQETHWQTGQVCGLWQRGVGRLQWVWSELRPRECVQVLVWSSAPLHAKATMPPEVWGWEWLTQCIVCCSSVDIIFYRHSAWQCIFSVSSWWSMYACNFSASVTIVTGFLFQLLHSALTV